MSQTGGFNRDVILDLDVMFGAHSSPGSSSDLSSCDGDAYSVLPAAVPVTPRPSAASAKETKEQPLAAKVELSVQGKLDAAQATARAQGKDAALKWLVRPPPRARDRRETLPHPLYPSPSPSPSRPRSTTRATSSRAHAARASTSRAMSS